MAYGSFEGHFCHQDMSHNQLSCVECTSGGLEGLWIQARLSLLYWRVRLRGRDFHRAGELERRGARQAEADHVGAGNYKQ